MSIEKRILQHIHELPESKKVELLDYIRYLRAKSETDDWGSFSLTSAMRGMEDEDSPYSLNDLRESFS